MKVYVVIYDYYDQLDVMGVFTDYESASLLANEGSNYIIKESMLDLSGGRIYWKG